jgi:hypothetical protein
MTTQSVSATVWGGTPTRGRTFSDTATDGIFDGNNMTSTVGGGELGQVLKGKTINYVVVQYTAGACFWKIMDRTTQAVKRYGGGVKALQAINEDGRIPPYVVNESDILLVFTNAV